MNRRTFLGAVLAAALSLRVKASNNEPKKLILGAPLTHSDWILKPNIPWGEAGVRHMLDACKACGWSRIYWRALDGGRALYHSKIVRIENKWDEDSYWNPQSPEDKALSAKYTTGMSAEKKESLRKQLDSLNYETFDTLAAAVEYGHKIGLEIHAWVSINEDDHGWGLRSNFAKDHPEFAWVKRDGRRYHSQMSFAFPQVRQYKLSILDELLKNYAIDGVFLDWIRTGDVRDNPQTDAQGIADSGYETPNVEAFMSEFGVDPHNVPNEDERWIDQRAQPQTIFMREARKLVGRKPLAVMVSNPWAYRGTLDEIDGSLRGLLLDVKTWAGEGLMDSAVAAGYYRDGGNAEKAWQSLRDETGGKIDTWLYGWVPQNAADANQNLDLAEKVGAKQVLFWEADYIDDRANAAEIKNALTARAKV